MIVKRALGADQQADDHNVPMFTDADGLNPGTIQNDVATAAGGSCKCLNYILWFGLYFFSSVFHSL